MTSFSVVIPVKDGERYLEEVLAAVRRENPEEVLVIDSGSRDASPDIARRAGVDLLSIEPGTFAHGRTRNLGAERTRGELICFLTQDATPCPGWLAAYDEAFGLAEGVGAAYGPHLPRPGTSPMVARELEEFFGSMSSDGQPRLQLPGDPVFLSNVNACYSRRCWEEIRFRDVAYAEDQAFGADLLVRGWLKVYHPGAAVLHSHDYPLAEFMRRYFEEYRGLRATLGHVEPFGLRPAVRQVAKRVAGDRRWLAEHGINGAGKLGWTGRSLAHHGGRAVFAALGSRAESLPRPFQRALSHERRRVPASPPSGPPAPIPPTVRRRQVAPRLGEEPYDLPYQVSREGATPLRPAPPGLSSRQRLRLAMLIPRFSRGSGGHNTLLQILLRLEQRGHVCSVWLHDYTPWGPGWPGKLRHDIREYFAPIEGAVYSDFGAWHGTDVVIATGWETVHAALRLEDCHARAYIVNDYEPDFFAKSVEQLLAEDTYRHGLHCIAASPWLRDLLRERYGASADAFQLGVDHAVYRPRKIARRRDTVVYYARRATPRRAVPLGLTALAELYRRRPEVRIVLFGSADPVPTSFPYEHAGILTAEELSWLYSEATVGLCLSLTNFSLMPKEMLACGLPCVELEGISAESIFGASGPIELAAPDPQAICAALEKLLDDRALWAQRSAAGLEFVASHTWEHATDEVEAGIRHALKLREAAVQQIR